MLATTLSLFAIVALALSSRGGAKEPPQGYPASIPANDVMRFAVVLAERVDIAKPGHRPEGEVLAPFLDAYSRSPVSDFVPTSEDLVPVVIWRTTRPKPGQARTLRVGIQVPFDIIFVLSQNGVQPGEAFSARGE